MHQGTVESVFRFRDVLICPDADPALIFSDFHDAYKKRKSFLQSCLAYFFPKVRLHQSQSQKWKAVQKKGFGSAQIITDPDPEG